MLHMKNNKISLIDQNEKLKEFENVYERLNENKGRWQTIGH